MRSRIYFSDRMKTTAKGQLWIPGFLMLGFLLTFPTAMLVKLGNWQALNYTSEQLLILYENLWRDGMVQLGAFVAVCAAAINGFHGFFYLYSGKKVDFYHGLPMKRSRMFLEKIVTGLIYYLVPYVAMEFLAICLGAAKGFFSLKLMGMAVQMLLFHLLIYLLIYFMIVLILCITGNLLTGMVCIGGIFLYGYALEMVLVNYAASFFETYTSTRRSYGIVKFLESYGTPEGFITTAVQAYADGKAAKLMVAMILLTAVILTLSYLAYNRRPSESAGKSMVYRWVAVVLKYFTVIPFALGIGWIFYPLVPGRMKLIWWAFGLLLGTVLGHGIIEVLYHMSFHGFFARKLQLVIAGIAVAVCAWCYQSDVIRFDDYIPKQDAIASINVDMASFDYEFSYSYVDKIENEECYAITESYEWYEPAVALSSGSGIGDKTYQAIQKIVAGRYSYESYAADNGNNGSYRYSVSMKYTLRSGREIYRNYIVDAELLKPLMKGLYEEENLKDQKYSFCKIDTSYLTGVDLADAEGNRYSIFQNDPQKQEELIAALQKDIASASPEDLMTETAVQIGLNYELPGKNNVNNMTPGKNGFNEYGYWYFGIPGSFENTLAILRETGYPLSLDEVNINRIRLVWFHDLEDDQPEEIIYEDEKEIRELRDALIYSTNGTLYTEEKVYPMITVVLETDHGSGENLSMELLKDKVPDFVRDKLEETGTELTAAETEENESAETYEDEELIF